jgi:Flp pilus assembly protein TadD
MLALRTAMALAPEIESPLAGLAFAAVKANQLPVAIDAFGRAIAINPWNSSYRAELALALARSGGWSDAVAACQETMRLNPARVEVR